MLFRSLELAKSVHKWCVDSILDVFGVTKAEANKGKVPDVPGINPGSGKTPELKGSKRK